jgi:hypothetical protein
MRRSKWPHKERRPQVGQSKNADSSNQRYLAQAREAQVAGDVIEMENCCQRAEHNERYR